MYIQTDAAVYELRDEPSDDSASGPLDKDGASDGEQTTQADEDGDRDDDAGADQHPGQALIVGAS